MCFHHTIFPENLTPVYSPHNAESWSTNFIEWFAASENLPENDTPAKHITFLTVVGT